MSTKDTRSSGSRWLVRSAVSVLLPALTCAASSMFVVTDSVAQASGHSPGNASAPQLTLVHQSPWVEPTTPGSPQTFTLDLAVAKGTPGSDRIVASVYNRLLTRSGFNSTLSGPPSSLLDRAGPLLVSSLPAAGPKGGIAFTVAVEPTATAAPRPAPGTPTFNLRCSATTGTCPGVYPVVVSLERPSGGSVARFTTYLTYVEGTSNHPLSFAAVLPVVTPIAFRPGTVTPGGAIFPLSHAATASFEGLASSLTSQASVPVTLDASPFTLSRLKHAGSEGSAAAAAIAAASANPAIHQVLNDGFVPFDLGAYTAAGEQKEVAAQITTGASTFARLGVDIAPGPSIWVTQGPIDPGLSAGLPLAGATRVLLPDATLAAPPGGGANGTWTTPFSLNLGHGANVTAATSDGGLASLYESDRADPVLEANQMLADLAMIHFEAPNEVRPRGVVALAPESWAPDAGFDGELLAGLNGNPIVTPTTLSGFFHAFGALGTAPPPAPAGGSGGSGGSDSSGGSGSGGSSNTSTATTTPTVPTRHLLSSASGDNAGLSPALAKSLTSSRLSLTSFDSAVAGSPAPPVVGELATLLLASESNFLSHTDATKAMGVFDRSFDQQLGLISLAADRSITLTARTGEIPITISSAAPYTVLGRLVLSGDRFLFPQGSSQHLVIDHPTNSVRVTVEARSSGDLPLQVDFVAPSGNLVIAHGELTVRSTATSAVGVILTIVAAIVLLSWWGRTSRASRRRHRAEPRIRRGTISS